MKKSKEEILKAVFEYNGSMFFNALVPEVRKRLNDSEYDVRKEVLELRRDGYLRTTQFEPSLNPNDAIMISERGIDNLLPWWQRVSLWNKLRNPLVFIVGLSSVVSAVVAVFDYFYPHK